MSGVGLLARLLAVPVLTVVVGPAVVVRALLARRATR